MQAIDWQKIVDKHGASVWQVSYRLLGNYTDASDCFQETFVSALKVSKRQKIKNFYALLIRLATARAIDQLRKRFCRESMHSLIDTETYASNKVSDPSNFAQNQELAESLRKAIVQLPVQEAQVFCMRHLNDMSYREIARELDIKKNHVGVLLCRAKEKLQKSLTVSLYEKKSEVVP